jgi:hypothetical protein
MIKYFLIIGLSYILGAVFVATPCIYFLVKPQTPLFVAACIGGGSTLIGATIGMSFASIILNLKP